MRVLDHLVQAVRSAATYNRDNQIAPYCILWPDRERMWEPALPLLLSAMPELLCLGPYAPEKRTGPAIWLRCAVAGKIDDLQLPSDRVPVLYLPGVSRKDLRAGDASSELHPLLPLQYLGSFFSQVSSKDWTIRAFLKTDQGGLGLDVAMDNETKETLRLALDKFLLEDKDFLQGIKLDKTWFNTLLTGGDPVRDILLWLDDPAAFQAEHTDNTWQAFVAICRTRLAFDPAKDGPLAGSELLARHEGPWQPVWERFCEAPGRYAHIPEQIKKCPPPKGSLHWYQQGRHTEGWPQWNEEREDDLRAQLLDLSSLPEHEARERILALEEEHGARRSLVWAALSRAPLAQALLPLSLVARHTRHAIAADSVEAMKSLYLDHGWQADDNALRALAHADNLQNARAITTVLRAVYLPWLEASARNLQALCAREGYPGGSCRDCAPSKYNQGDCVLFVDGLRLDLAQRLASLLEERGCTVKSRPFWTALPSVTATGKPAASPVRDMFLGTDRTADFAPSVRDGGQAQVTSQVLKRLLNREGWTVLDSADAGNGQGMAWCESGDIDHEGHGRGWKLAAQAETLVQETAQRIDELLQAGWKRIRVVTDHGWLLVPDGLPKTELPAFLTENRWGRCAVLKEGASCDERLFPWFWNPDSSVALADGVSCFKKGEEYAHGGLSFQECLTLQLTVTDRVCTKLPMQFTDIAWKGLRCTAAAEGESAGIRLDIRKKAADESSSIVVAPKGLKENGTASVVVEDEDLEGTKAFLVLVDDAGTLLAQREIVVGSTVL